MVNDRPWEYIVQQSPFVVVQSSPCSRQPLGFQRPLGRHSPQREETKTITKVLYIALPLLCANTLARHKTGLSSRWPSHRRPGKHVIRGRAKYRLLDEKVRVFVAPPIEEIVASPVSHSVVCSSVVSNFKPSSPQLKPYVSIGKKLSTDQERAVFSKFHGVGGITPAHFLRVAREHTFAKENPGSPAARMDRMPAWMSARIRLGLMEDPRKVPVVVGGSGSVGGSLGRFQNLGKRLRLVGQLGTMKSEG